MSWERQRLKHSVKLDLESICIQTYGHRYCSGLKIGERRMKTVLLDAVSYMEHQEMEGISVLQCL